MQETFARRLDNRGGQLSASFPLAHPFWCLLPRASCGRADTYEDILLPVTQEVAGSNLGAPTTYFFIINELSLTLQRWRPNLGPTWVQVHRRVAVPEKMPSDTWKP